MDLSTYLERLREDLLSTAAIGDEDFRRAAAVLSTAIEPSARLAIMNALSDLATEITGALDDTTVDLKLDGRDVKVSVTRHRAAPADDVEDHPDASFGPRAEDMEELRRAMAEAGGDLSRTTVRMLGDLKAQAEQAAADHGMSLNTYISRAVHDSLRGSFGRPPPGGRGKPGRAKGPGNTVSGFIQA